MRNIPVVQMDLDGKDIAVYKCASEAANKLGLNHSHITTCCRGLADRVKQYRFRYSDRELNHQAEITRRDRKHKATKNRKVAWIGKKKKIYQFSLNGVFIAEYDDVDKASQKTSIPKQGIRNCCIGVTINCGGYIWRYNNTAVSVLENDIPTEAGEEWRDVIGYEGLYMVSSHGRVWSVRRRLGMSGTMAGGFMLANHIDKRNRVTNSFSSQAGKHKTVVTARLVAEAFIPNPSNLPQVNHKDENPLNNHVDNLEWCTAKYNCNYGSRTARIKANMPQNKAVYQTTMTGQIIAEFPTILEASRQTGISAGHICSVCKGDREYANGYKWKYADDELSLQAIRNLEEKQKKSKASRKEKFIQNSRCVSQHDLNGDFLKIWRCMREIAEELGYARSNIINCCNGKIQKAYGYIWKYAD